MSVQECSKSVSEYLKSVARDNENDFDGNEIKPVDSASNISHKSTRSSRSTTSSVLRAQAEAKRAGPMAKEAALKEKHELEKMALKEKQEWEAKQEETRKKIEAAELEAEIKAANAEIDVLNTYGDGMNSYVSRTMKQTSKPKVIQTEATTKPTSMQTVNVTHPNKPEIKLQTKSVTANIQTDFQPTQNSFVPTTHEQNNLLIQFLQNQNEMFNLLIKQQNANQLPPRDITIFEGDPLKYKVFIQAFKQCVENKCSSKGDCLYFLERYTRGRLERTGTKLFAYTTGSRI